MDNTRKHLELSACQNINQKQLKINERNKLREYKGNQNKSQEKYRYVQQ